MPLSKQRRFHMAAYQSTWSPVAPIDVRPQAWPYTTSPLSEICLVKVSIKRFLKRNLADVPWPHYSSSHPYIHVSSSRFSANWRATATYEGMVVEHGSQLVCVCVSVRRTLMKLQRARRWKLQCTCSCNTVKY